MWASSAAAVPNPESDGLADTPPAAGEGAGAEGETGAEGEVVADGAAAAEPELTEEEKAIAEFHASLAYRQGEVEVGDGLAKLNVPDTFRYLDPQDADRVLQAWGNPPGMEPLGMLLPADLQPMDDESWAVVITYVEEGHVEDEDAADIDYDELLDEMKQDTKGANEARAEAGYGEVHLLGWAEPPSYDAETKKMYWAKELDFGGEKHTLNYDIRVLGRKGVLELGAVASIDQLDMVRGQMHQVMSFVDFQPGNTYADFDPDVDEVATYGISALVAGKVAAKAGLFKALFAGLVASKKLIIGAFVGLIALLKGLLGRKREGEDAA